jgi:hypothetical protein
VGGNAIIIQGDAINAEVHIPLADLRAAHEGFFPKLMNASKSAS